MVFGGGAFERWLGHEGGALMNEISALIKDTPESNLTPSTMWGHSENMVINGFRSELSPDTKFASALILDFPASRTVSKTILLLISHPAYGIFVIAAWKD